MTTEHDPTARIRELLALDRSTLPPDGGERFNRLIFEASPYLLQHAENPVRWYPWGEEAFAAARAADLPLFLSIGYATCHWCHVMAHESFEDPEVAAVINRQFVPVKVDREERPDIDDQYMLVAQMMTGSGGWPLTVIMTPERQPFFVATYLPKLPRTGMPGIVELLGNIARLWRSRRDLVASNCAKVMAGLARQTAATSAGGVVDSHADAAWRQLEGMYDRQWGGFGGAPKFPLPHYLSFLVLRWHRTGETQPLWMAEQTLAAMRRGGICDQLGFGFHRYAVDRQWLAPHFEKMLYDQALIAGAALDVFRAGGDPAMREIAEEILAGVAAALTSPEGGFSAALDADSGGEEGRYYLWRPAEILAALGEAEGELCCRLFGVTDVGNFEGKSILHLERSPDEFAAAEGIPADQFRERLAQWRHLLLAARGRRVPPLRDEKILTAWNGLMIAAFADAGALTGHRPYLYAAERAAACLGSRLVTPEGRLLRSWHAGREGGAGFLEDYALFATGLVALHQATLDERHLAAALRLTREMLRLFGDPAGGLLCDTGSDVEPPLIRTRGIADGVVPSGNAAAALLLIRLGRITGDEGLVARGEGIVAACAGSTARVPVNHLRMLAAADLLREGGIEIELAGERESDATAAFLRECHRRCLPGLALRFTPREGMVTTARLCAAGICHPPVDTPGELAELLGAVCRA